LRSLAKTKYNYQLFSDAEECAICWSNYSEQDEIVKLKCNEKHFYHTKCIENWIKAGKNTCPMCREPINKDVTL